MSRTSRICGMRCMVRNPEQGRGVAARACARRLVSNGKISDSDTGDCGTSSPLSSRTSSHYLGLDSKNTSLLGAIEFPAEALVENLRVVLLEVDARVLHMITHRGLRLFWIA